MQFTINVGETFNWKCIAWNIMWNTHKQRLVLTELCEKVGTRESAGQEGNYETITTPDNSEPGRVYQEMEMSRRWLESFYDELLMLNSHITDHAFHQKNTALHLCDIRTYFIPATFVYRKTSIKRRGPK